MGVERVFSGGTLDQDVRFLLDQDVCPLTLDRGPGTEEMLHVGVLWGVGGVLGEEADVEAVVQDDEFQDDVVEVVSWERSAEDGGCGPGSKGPLRPREGERGALELWGSAAEGYLACDKDLLDGGNCLLERNGHHNDHDGRGHLGNPGRLGEGGNPPGEKEGVCLGEDGSLQGEDGSLQSEDDAVCRVHRANHQDGTWICVDGRGRSSR